MLPRCCRPRPTTETLAESSNRALGWSFGFSIGLALWSAMSLTQAIFATLNIAYEEEERRSFVRFYLSAFIFALAGIIGGVVMLLTSSMCRSCSPMPAIRGLRADHRHCPLAAAGAFSCWPARRALSLSARAARSPKWSWVSVGSAVLHHALAARLGRLLVLCRAFRAIRQNLRLARRSDRAAVLALSHLLHHPARRRDQRRARIADRAVHDAR